MNNTSVLKSLPEPLFTPIFRNGSSWIKFESEQHTQSVKYNMVYEKLKRALYAGSIKEDTTLLEVTAGSTGVALAFAGKLLDLNVELHTYTGADPKKCQRIQDLGATLVKHSGDIPLPDILALVKNKAHELNNWHLNQYDQHSNIKAYQSMAEKIIDTFVELGDFPEIFVCPVGTGGLIQGIGQKLKEHAPSLKIYSVEPQSNNEIDGIRNTQDHYMGDLDPYDRNFPDQRFTVPAPSPSQQTIIHGYQPGPSSQAVLQLIEEQHWQKVFFIAPD